MEALYELDSVSRNVSKVRRDELDEVIMLHRQLKLTVTWLCEDNLSPGLYRMAKEEKPGISYWCRQST